MDAIRVLIIDDNEAHAEGLSELLKLAGFESYHALTGNEGIELAQVLAIDAILLDMNLTDMTGYDVCHELRKDPKTANTAIIFHTASESSPLITHKADAYLTYPVEFDVLFNVIRECVAKRRQEQV